jgi:hypothetical protein
MAQSGKRNIYTVPLCFSDDSVLKELYIYIFFYYCVVPELTCFFFSYDSVLKELPVFFGFLIFYLWYYIDRIKRL